MLLFLAAMFLAVSAFAQVTTASLGGRVTDSNGEAADLLFDQSSRDMIMQMNLFQDGTSYAVKLFFKK